MKTDRTEGAELCREQLRVLLTEETESLRELETLLLREHEVLGAGNVAAIERIAVTRQERMGALARIEEHRRGLCSAHGYTADWLGLEGLMQWCDPAGSLLVKLRECAALAVRCRDLNDRNGTLVAARLKQVEGMLAALGGPTRATVTYGPKGSPTSAGIKRELGAA